MTARRTFFCSVAALCLTVGVAAQQPNTSRTDQLRREERQDYFKKWLNEDVVYIITEEEKAVFNKLTTEEEREQFVEQFWLRRDPDPKTFINEAKEEHYRRIAYANDHFGSGKPGWRSDRGRIYIIHGEPVEIQENFGGPYSRPMYEGGGETAVFPYQVWRYRSIDGLGPDIELEFVDTTLTGDYHLASDPFEKDAFTNVPGIGLTMAEERGLATKHDRFIKSGGGEYYPLLAQRYQDKPFVRLERYAGIMRPARIKYPDLKQIVDVDVTYSTLPFRFHQSQFRLNDRQCIVPITLEFANRSLTFQDKDGRRVSRLAIYGTVTGLGKQVVKEFEDEVINSFSADYLRVALQGKSLYQKLLVLEKGRRVKLTLVVKDLNGGKIGTLSRVLVPPNYATRDLELSTLVLSNSIQKLARIPETDEMFVLGDIKIRPSLDRVFPTDRLMGSYLQVYNAGIDQQTLQPSLRVKYKLYQGEKPLMEIVDDKGESIEFYSGERVVLNRMFSPKDLGAGKYRLQVEVFDRVNNQSAMIGDEFEIVSAAPKPGTD
ncbi:MAG: GWxTD domain-containing protein [Acidobacteria bacterium]|nr:MAG: GWxTD domain-containing protein [Acidobacteriota bacterium]